MRRLKLKKQHNNAKHINSNLADGGALEVCFWILNIRIKRSIWLNNEKFFTVTSKKYNKHTHASNSFFVCREIFVMKIVKLMEKFKSLIYVIHHIM